MNILIAYILINWYLISKTEGKYWKIICYLLKIILHIKAKVKIRAWLYVTIAKGQLGH